MPTLVQPEYPLINDPARPTWHFGPPAQWMNDPNGVVFYQGWWHVFYQHNPGGDVWADMHWGHARSRDLVHWQHLPIALWPQHALGEHHCYSGCCVLNAAQEPHILYTRVPPDDSRPASQVLAVPVDRDLTQWTQQVATPVLDLATHDGPAFRRDWRDPYVFQTEGRTFLILGAVLGEEAVLPIYENPGGDLSQWIYRGIILRAPLADTPFFECPSIIPFGHRWVLFCAPCHEVEWFSGTLDLQEYQFQIERRGRFDESRDLYAPHAKPGPDNQVVALSWIQNFPKGRNWNGCLGVPRRIWLDDAGLLRTAPIREIAALHENETLYHSAYLTSTPLVLIMPGQASSHGELVFDLPENSTLQIEVAGVKISIATAGLRFDDRPVVALPDHNRIHFEWLLDRSLLELFVNESATYTRVLPYPVGHEISLTASSREVALSSGQAWAMRSATPTTES